MPSSHQIKIVDSHTGGEPTRVVLAGGPDLGAGPLAGRVRRFQQQHDRFRTAIVGEPRGSEPMVGALLVEPHLPGCRFGVIFFNGVGYLGMCGHGTIGLIVSLAHLGRVQPGPIMIDTPVGSVEAVLHPSGEVSFTNVPSYRKAKGVKLSAPDGGAVVCDVAWGGNWFGLVEGHGQTLDWSNVAHLVDYCARLREALHVQGFPEVDHMELFAPSTEPGVSSRNFVLCPGRAYDRSPCGTGTSAKLACLAADGKLTEGAEWVQESIVGSRFRARYRRQGERVLPTITGTAFVNAEATLIVEPGDPFAWGIR